MMNCIFFKSQRTYARKFLIFQVRAWGGGEGGGGNPNPAQVQCASEKINSNYNTHKPLGTEG